MRTAENCEKLVERSELLSGQHMEVQVVNRLSGALAAVGHNAEAFGKAELLCELGNDCVDMAPT